MIAALWAIARFIWIYGPQALALLEALYQLIERMTDKAEQDSVTAELVQILAEKDPKPVRLARLKALVCKAQACKLR